MMTTAVFKTSQLGTHHGSAEPDPLLLNEVFAHSATVFALGFAVSLETNTPELLNVAAESWGSPCANGTAPAVRLRVGVKQSEASECPGAPSVRTHGHLLSMIADAENFLLCDLRESTAFGWVNTAALHHRRYLRYHFLEAVAMCLLSTSRVTPIHAACVSFADRGFLFCGPSGAGKSTLAYACARAGWTYTSDDASYLLWNSFKHPLVRGNAYQLRFRPSASQLFPEIQGRELTPRAEGKPSIEVPTIELAGLTTSLEAQVHWIVLLRRQSAARTELTALTPAAVIPLLETSLYPFVEIWQPQLDAMQRLLTAPIYSLQYSCLGDAVARLELLARKDLLP